MSEEQVSANAETPDQANANGTEVSEEAQKLSAAEVNARLLRESQQYKERAKKSESEAAELRKFRDAALKEKMEYKPLFEEATKKLSDLEERVRRTTILAAVKEVGLKMGCIDTDLLLAAGPAGVLDYDKETLEPVGVSEFVESAKKAKPFLFAQPKTPTINAATPGGAARNNVQQPKPMSKEEIIAQLKALQQQGL